MQDAERIYRLWDDALGKKDLEASLSLYADDASIESPLVQHLMKTKDGLVHRVSSGNYLGQADGKITDITPSKISLVEIVPDGLGGYMERPAGLALNE